MSRAWKLGGAIVLAATCIGGAVVPRVARARVAHAVVERCHRVLDGECTLGEVHLALDGVFLRDVRVRMRGGRYTARVHRVGARFRWVPLLFGQRQPIEVELDGVELSGRASLDQVLTDLRSRSRDDGAPARSSRLRIRGVHVTDVRAHVTVTDLAGHDLGLRLQQGGFEWSLDTRALSMRWRDLSAEYPGTRAHTGSCIVLDGIDTTTSLDCREFEAEVDTARARVLREAVEGALAVLSPTRDTASPLVPSPAVEPIALTSARQAQIRFQDGRVKVMHGDDVIADLAPATMSALTEGTSLKEATFQLGGESTREPSLSLSFNRMHEPWQVDLDAGALPLRRLAPWVPSVPWHGVDEGRAHARVHVEPGDTADRLDVSGDLFLEDFGLQHPGLAHEPIDGFSVSLDGRAIVDLTRRRVSTQGLNWQVNGIPFSVAGWVERGSERTSMALSLNVPMVTCDGAMRSLPRPVTGVAANLGLTGTIGGSVHLALDTRRLSETVFDYNVQDGCQVTVAGYGLNVHRFAEPFVQRVQEPGNRVRAFVTGPGSPAWVSVEALPPNLLNAVISREDGGFYRHQGFSPGEIRGALVRNVSEGRFAYGASTLSMQLVKNVFLAREKTLVRKLQEVVLTWWLERSFSKQQILELYLNVVEFGPGIYGIGPASRFFFAREPRDLTPLQAIYLATLLPAPIPRFAIFQRGAPAADTLARLRAIARAMAATGLMSSADAEAAQHETFTFRARTAPVPGAATLDVDVATTDEAARVLAERAMVNVHPTPEAPATTETPTDSDAQPPSTPTPPDA